MKDFTELQVLYVDDSPTMRRIIKNSLVTIGFVNHTGANNGVDALEKLEEIEVDLIVTDWNMPEMNGEELVRNLRANPKYKDTPILMVTTRGVKDDVITAVKTGVSGYVVKPFTIDILKAKIKDILK